MQMNESSHFHETHLSNDPEWRVGSTFPANTLQVGDVGGEDKYATVRSKEVGRDKTVRYHLCLHEDQGFYGEG